MKIYCTTCKEYILNTSDAFVLGGPYDGSMFDPITNDRYRATMFRCTKDTIKANLHCPRCMGEFISFHGDILTEHGLLPKGQRTIDTRQTIVHQSGHAKGMLMHIVNALPVIENRVSAAAEERQKEIDQMFVDEPEEKLICGKCGKQYTNSDSGRIWYDKHIEKCSG